MSPRAGFANGEGRDDALVSQKQRFWGGVPNSGPPLWRALSAASGPMGAIRVLPAPQGGEAGAKGRRQTTGDAGRGCDGPFCWVSCGAVAAISAPPAAR